MERKIYNAMRARINMLPFEEEKKVYEEMGWTVLPGSTFYRFNADGLPDDIDSIVHPMQTRNIWNVCQRFYSFLRYYDNIDNILLNS